MKKIEDVEYMAVIPGIALKQQIASNQSMQLILQCFAAMFMNQTATLDKIGDLIECSGNLSDLNKIYIAVAERREMD